MRCGNSEGSAQFTDGIQLFATLNITHTHYAAVQRDFTIEPLKAAKSEEERGRHIEALREDLNRR